MIRVIHYADTNSVEVTWSAADGKQARCHSYSQYQMDMLRDDLGSDAQKYEGVISAVLARPVPESSQEQVVSQVYPVTSISLAQARAGLILRGLFGSVVAHIEAIEDPVQRELARNDFEYRNEVEVGHPLVGEIKALLAWTDEQVLEFFAFCHSL